jgi:hypothetical protein
VRPLAPHSIVSSESAIAAASSYTLYYSESEFLTRHSQHIINHLTGFWLWRRRRWCCGVVVVVVVVVVFVVFVVFQ